MKLMETLKGTAPPGQGSSQGQDLHWSRNTSLLPAIMKSCFLERKCRVCVCVCVFPSNKQFITTASDGDIAFRGNLQK